MRSSAPDFSLKPICVVSWRHCHTHIQVQGTNATEADFLSLRPPTALQLRAWLQQTQGFNPFYTGYGYTAEVYDHPGQREYVLENVVIDNLPSVGLMPFETKPQ